jgi:GDP-L-fucose synthase
LITSIKQKIFIAGHRGMVGSAICRQLSRSQDATIVMRARDELNLVDQAAANAFFATEKPDQVYLAAAKVGGIHANNTYPAEFIYENLMVQANVIEAAFRHGVRKLLFLGSSCIYPRMIPQPMNEASLLTGTLEPTNEPYAIAKIAGIKMCAAYNRQHGTNYLSVMPTNLYGPNDNFDLESSHVFPALIRKFVESKKSDAQSVNLWGTGKPRREFLHVEDLAKAIVFCLDNYDSDQQINIGTGIDLTVAELAEKIAKSTGFTGSINWDVTRGDGTPQKVLDIQKITNLGWKPTINLDQGIKLTVEWYLENK